MSELKIIGELSGAKVLVDHDSRSVILAHPDMPPIKFSIEHPYIQGSKLEREARIALDGTAQLIGSYIDEHTDDGR